MCHLYGTKRERGIVTGHTGRNGITVKNLLTRKRTPLMEKGNTIKKRVSIERALVLCQNWFPSSICVKNNMRFTRSVSFQILFQFLCFAFALDSSQAANNTTWKRSGVESDLTPTLNLDRHQFMPFASCKSDVFSLFIRQGQHN